MIDFDELRRDREAGTPGRWQVSGVRYKWRAVDSNQTLTSHAVGPDGDAVGIVFYTPEHHAEQFANARRIARVPALEALALAAEGLAEAATAIRHHGPFQDRQWISEELAKRLAGIGEALAAYGAAREGK